MEIGIVGITGKMGTILSSIIPASEQYRGISSKTSPREHAEIISSSDVIIDFSSPNAALEAIRAASQYKVPVITGTTGFSKEEFDQIKTHSATIPILHSSNFSIALHLMSDFVKRCSDVFPDFDFCIIDKHHNQKKDAPSGTALFLASQASQRAQIVSLREGNIFGEHICDFAGKNEMLSISHQVFTREVFAIGAFKCAQWIIGRDPKLYEMKDYLKTYFALSQ